MGYEDEMRNLGDRQIGGDIGAAYHPPQHMHGQGHNIREPRSYLWRRQTLGINSSGTIAAGAATTITARPQRDFKGVRPVFTSDIAFFFDVTDWKVGQNSQNVGAGTIPAAMFTETAWGIDVEWDTANLGNEISIFCTNNDTVAHQLRAGIVGLVAQPQY